MSILSKIRKDKAISRLSEEILYARVAEEIKNGIKRDGLWAKALAETELNEDKAKALYITYRVQSLIDESNLSRSEEITRSVDATTIAAPPKKDYAQNSIGTSRAILICQNCNREGRMLLKKSPVSAPSKLAFLILGGLPGIIISNILDVNHEIIPLMLWITSYIILYFIFFNKRHLQCPACGNIGSVSR